MLKIGITGGIGSGKSYISSIFQKLGIPVYSADERAKTLMNTHEPLIKEIKYIFGNDAYSQNKLNRQYIAKEVFNNKKKLEQLNNIVHPAVDIDFRLWCENQNELIYVLKEAAILFESGSFKKLDKNIVVTAPKEIRIERVMIRDGSSKAEIESRMKNQWPTDKLVTLADFVINNDGKKLILPQIIEIDNKIKNTWQSLESGLEQA